MFFFAVSTCLVPLVVSVNADLEVPWGPHCAVRLQMLARLRAVQCRRLIVPRPFPIDEFAASGGGAMDSLQWARSLEWAGSRIEWGSAVGVPDLQPQQFVPPTADPPSSSGGMHDAHDNDRSDLMLDSMLLGSRFSMISIAAEHYVCIKSGLCDSGIDRYIGRGQYPRLETKPLVCRSVEASRFSCERCDY